LRDKDSAALAKKMAGRKDIKYSGDPAEGFVKRFMKENIRKIKKRKQVSFYLRKWPVNYTSLPEGKYKTICQLFDKEIAKAFQFLNNLGYKIKLIPMHYFYIGDDDREYYRNIIYHCFGNQSLKNKISLSLDKIEKDFLPPFQGWSGH